MDKFYTGFFFQKSIKTFHPTDLHCTHKYLGELSADQIELVIDYCEGYLNSQPAIPFPRAVFDFPETFSNLSTSGGSIRVLKSTSYNWAEWFPSLRTALDRFRKDEFPFAHFTPHVSTPHLNRINEPFACYALVNSTRGTIEHFWLNHGT